MMHAHKLVFGVYSVTINLTQPYFEVLFEISYELTFRIDSQIMILFFYSILFIIWNFPLGHGFVFKHFV